MLSYLKVVMAIPLLLVAIALGAEALEENPGVEKVDTVIAGDNAARPKDDQRIPAEGPEYEAARPKDGKIDDKANLAREEAIVRKIVKHGKTSLLVLGCAHNLAPIIKKHEGWGYVRVKPKGYPE